MRQLLMRRSNLGTSPDMPVLPGGLRLRVAAHADSETLACLLAAAFGDDTWTIERVGSSLLDAPDVPTTYIVVDGRRAVATASVLLREDRPRCSGYLHWVAVDPRSQGNRLGQVVSLAVLHDFSRMNRHNVCLKTDDERLPAIKTYINLGFAGVIRNEDERVRWAKIADSIPSVTTVDDFDSAESVD